MKRLAWPLVAAILVAIPAAVTISYAADWLRATADEEHWPAPSQTLMTPLPGPAVSQPATVPGTAADLDDDEEVIGIAVDGKYRAYRIKTMANPAEHIVNDLVNRVPVTVTYCDISDCAQAFTAEQRDKPLDISSGGFDGEMMLRSQDVFFWQRTGMSREVDRASELVFPRYPLTRMKWKDWRKLHPQSDVYVGSTG